MTTGTGPDRAGAVRAERHGDILVLVIDNPPVNASTAAVRAGLLAHIEQAAGSADVAAAVLVGARDSFVAGSDLREFSGPVGRPLLPAVIAAVEHCPKPVVAALDGLALGGGLELALGCDWRIATPRCRLGLPEVTLGMVPGAGGTQRLPRLVGRAAAVDLIVSGRRIDGSSAHRLGLVDEVVEPAVLLDRAVAAARRVGKRPVRRLPVPDEGDRPVRRLPVPDEGDRPVPDAAKPGRPQRPPVAEAIRLVQLAGGGPIDEALAEERRVFDDLRRRPEARALRHLFFAERRASKVDEVGTVRCYAAYRRQCEFMLEEGALPEQVDQALVDFGFARGPFAEADLSGLDTAGATRRRRIRRRALDPVEILDRAVFALVNEAALVLDEGVVPRPGDIDVAFVLRYGFPRHEGGPLWWAAHQPPQRVGAGMARVAETTGYGYRAGPVEEVLSAIRAAG